MKKLIRRQQPTQKKRSGAMLPLIAIMFPVFLAMIVFTVDVAYMQMVRTELRAAVDAASKAGVEALARTQDQDAATAAAIDIAGRNIVAGKGVLLTPDDVEFGRCVQQNNGSWQFTGGATPCNSLRVRVEMIDGSPNGAVPLLFGHMLGYDRFQPRQKSTAAYQENDICLVVDRSHSMCFDLSGPDWVYPSAIPSWPIELVYPPHSTESRWASLDQAVNTFLDEVSTANSSSRISLVTFGSQIDQRNPVEWFWTRRVFQPSTLEVKLTNDFAPIRSRIDALGNDIMLGGTHISAGMEDGIKELTSPRARPLSSKIMVLMTDGRWNRGAPPRDLALQARSKNITIHTVTFLPGSDQADMIEVATITGGRHFHADNGAQLVAIFRELARSLPVILVD